MSKTAYENALARRDEIKLEIDRHKSRIEALRREAKEVSEWLKGWDRYSALDAKASIDARARPTNPAKEIVVEKVRELIDRKGAPMRRAELISSLGDEGIIIEGEKPEMVLSTMLWRMKSRVVNLKQLGYWFAERDYPPAKYKALKPTKAPKST